MGAALTAQRLSITARILYRAAMRPIAPVLLIAMAMKDPGRKGITACTGEAGQK